MYEKKCPMDTGQILNPVIHKSDIDLFDNFKDAFKPERS